MAAGQRHRPWAVTAVIGQQCILFAVELLIGIRLVMGIVANEGSVDICTHDDVNVNDMEENCGGGGGRHVANFTNK